MADRKIASGSPRDLDGSSRETFVRLSAEEQAHDRPRRPVGRPRRWKPLLICDPNQCQQEHSQIPVTELGAEGVKHTCWVGPWLFSPPESRPPSCYRSQGWVSCPGPVGDSMPTTFSCHGVMHQKGRLALPSRRIGPKCQPCFAALLLLHRARVAEAGKQ